MGRERSRFQEDSAATLQQLERNIQSAKKKYDDLLEKIINLEHKKGDLDKYLQEAVLLKNNELQDKIKHCDTAERMLKGLLEDHRQKQEKLENDIKEFNDRRESEIKRLADTGKNLEDYEKRLLAKQSYIEGQEHDFTAKVLRFKNDLSGFDFAKKEFEELKSSVEQEARKNRLKAIELDERENVVDRELSEAEHKEVKLRELDFILKKKEKELSAISVVLTKEKEIFKKDKDNILSISKKNEEELRDIVIAKKKILIESQKLKDLEKELRNRESRLIEKENIINAKIGG